MEQADVQKFRVTLEKIQKVLEQPLGKRDEIAIEISADALDQVQHAANRELAVRQLEFESSRLKEVREAIRRIEEGIYGICLSCESDISLKRLGAVPWAAYCLNCQDHAEHQKQDADVKEQMFSKAPAEAELV